MRYAFVLPGGDIPTLVELAVEAEAAGWDGIFVPDCIYIDSELDPMAAAFDPWALLGAVAVRTSRLRLGTMITPPSRRRPWKLARETMTVDRLSGGRLVLPVGLGALDDGGFRKVGEATDRKTRAEMLDESLEILAGLWSARPFSFHGRHYGLEEMAFTPPPLQQPRIPVWVVAAWPREQSMRRALRWDGVIPAKMSADGASAPMTPDDVDELCAYVRQRRGQPSPFDVIVEGETPGGDAAAATDIVRPYAEAGATWWLESMWSPRVQREGWAGPEEASRARIRRGPPRQRDESWPGSGGQASGK